MAKENVETDGLARGIAYRKALNKLNLYLFIVNIVVTAIVLIAILVIWKNLPQTIPLHWDGQFAIDRYGDKNEFLILIVLPIILIASDVIMYFALRKSTKLEICVSHVLVAIIQIAYFAFTLALYAPYLS